MNDEMKEAQKIIEFEQEVDRLSRAMYAFYDVNMLDLVREKLARSRSVINDDPNAIEYYHSKGYTAERIERLRDKCKLYEASCLNWFKEKGLEETATDDLG